VIRPLFALLLVALFLRSAFGSEDSLDAGFPEAGTPIVWVAFVQADVDTPEPVGAAQERAALQFLGDQFPELVDLVGRLKEADPAEYANAIRELHETYEMLERLRNTDRRRYLHELKSWQLQSRIDVVTARLTVAPNPYLEKRLRDLVTERIDSRREWLLSERQAHLRRAEELGEEADKILDRRNELVDNALDQLLREVERARAVEAEKVAPREQPPADAPVRRGTPNRQPE